MKNVLSLTLFFLSMLLPLLVNAQNDSTYLPPYPSNKKYIFSLSMVAEHAKIKNQYSKDTTYSSIIESRMRLNKSGLNALFIFINAGYKKWKYEEFYHYGPSSFSTEERIVVGGGFGSNLEIERLSFKIGKKIKFVPGLDTKVDVIRSYNYGIFAFTIEPFISLSVEDKWVFEFGDLLDPYEATIKSPSIRLTYFFLK